MGGGTNTHTVFLKEEENVEEWGGTVDVNPTEST